MFWLHVGPPCWVQIPGGRLGWSPEGAWRQGSPSSEVAACLPACSRLEFCNQSLKAEPFETDRCDSHTKANPEDQVSRDRGGAALGTPPVSVTLELHWSLSFPARQLLA